jgi:hypothetical protein
MSVLGSKCGEVPAAIWRWEIGGFPHTLRRSAGEPVLLRVDLPFHFRRDLPTGGSQIDHPSFSERVPSGLMSYWKRAFYSDRF